MTEPVERRRPTPTDPRFRRGLYVMLIVLGLLAATSIIYARDARKDANSAAGQVNDLQEQNAKLLKMQEFNNAAALQRSKEAVEDRAYIISQLKRSAALQTLVLRALAQSSDAAVRAEAQRLGTTQPIPSLSYTPSSLPQPQPTPAPAPTVIVVVPAPSPRPSATPTPTPTPQPCLLAVVENLLQVPLLCS